MKTPRPLFSMAGCLSLLFLSFSPLSAQTVAKYGADFLASGVGARALGMGGAQVALVQDVTAGYWNVAGLTGVRHIEGAYMHAERFAGIVSFDYAAGALPLNETATVSLSIIRSGVNDIKNTLDAWDPVRDLPKANPENFITTFSAADYAFLLGYARRLNPQLSVGATGKIIRRKIGDFASAWGYSFDLSAQYQNGNLRLGVTLQDISTMLQTWSVNGTALQPLVDVFGDDLPVGENLLVLPVVRLGSGYQFPVGQINLTVALDLDLAFDGQRAYVYNMGGMSVHPRFGIEAGYNDVLYLRAGLNKVQNLPNEGFSASPSVGVGFHIKQVALDYGFGDFAGLTSDLGFSHRISLRFTLDRDRTEN